MTDAEINTALSPLLAAKPLPVLFQMAQTLYTQQQLAADAGSLPDISAGIVAAWPNIKAWALDGADGPRDLRALTADAKTKLLADQKAQFIVALLVLFKAALRAYPDIS